MLQDVREECFVEEESSEEEKHSVLDVQDMPDVGRLVVNMEKEGTGMVGLDSTGIMVHFDIPWQLIHLHHPLHVHRLDTITN